jgi:hypothetical protein
MSARSAVDRNHFPHAIDRDSAMMGKGRRMAVQQVPPLLHHSWARMNAVLLRPVAVILCDAVLLSAAGWCFPSLPRRRRHAIFCPSF